MTLIEIGRLAGQREVVEYVARHVQHKTVSGDPADIEPPQKLNFWQRLFKR